MALKIFRSVEKRLKLKVRKFWEVILNFVEVTGGKTGRGAFFASHLE